MSENAPKTPPAKAVPRIERLREFRLPSPVLALDATPDGSLLLAAGQDGSITALDAEAGSPRIVGRHESYASSVALLPDRRTVVSGGYDGTLRWHDLTEGKEIRAVKPHQFWSWDMAVSADGRRVATVTGRYEVGGYRYEPAPETEPSVKVYDTATGELLGAFPHVPPTQAVAVSADGSLVAAGNLMGEVRVWEVGTGRQVGGWKTDDLTGWGVIKSHHFVGGIFDLTFSPDGSEIYTCGMGPMADPMAGNGVQRWQRFDWRSGKKLDQTHEGESGQGLMETLEFHPKAGLFVMAGRLFQGTWNLALFETATGKSVFTTDAKHRISQVRFSADGSRLFVAKVKGQDRPKEGRWSDAGLVEIHSVVT
jgi:WD40 repeat protein